MTTKIEITITNLSDFESPAILLRELAEIIRESNDGELNRSKNKFGGEYSNVEIQVFEKK